MAFRRSHPIMSYYDFFKSHFGEDKQYKFFAYDCVGSGTYNRTCYYGIDNDFNYSEIEKVLKEKSVKLIEIQRSRGYSTRESITIDKLERVIKYIKNIDKKVIVLTSYNTPDMIRKVSELGISYFILKHEANL